MNASPPPPPESSPEFSPEFSIDPICKMKVNRQAPKGGSFAFLDTTYFFCNPRCREKFAADPERYLYARKPATPPAAARWLCPMCPEVSEASPVPCPSESLMFLK